MISLFWDVGHMLLIWRHTQNEKGRRQLQYVEHFKFYSEYMVKDMKMNSNK